MLNNRTEKGRIKSTRQLIYDIYCMERGDRHKTSKWYFYERLNTGYTYSQQVDQEEGVSLKRKFKRNKSEGFRKERYWKDYLQQNS